MSAGTPPTAAPAPAPIASGSGLAPHSGEHWSALPGDDDDDDAYSDLGSSVASSTTSLNSTILQYRTVNGRRYHSESDTTEYWGPNDERHQEPLDMQHHIWTLSLDNKLYAAPIGDDCTKVLDIGTGTGVWAIDFGDENAKCQVIGTDISPIQPSWTPANVRFEIDDFNKEWTFEPNSIDFIHARWLIGAVRDWDFFMKQAFEALKPGGWIETLETEGSFTADDGTVPPESALGRWHPLFVEFGKRTGMHFIPLSDAFQRKAVEAAGFTNIQEKFSKLPVGSWPRNEKLKDMGTFQQAVVEADLEGWVTYAATTLGWSRDQIIIYVAHVRKELRSHKTHPYLKANRVWAQKPMC